MRLRNRVGLLAAVGLLMLAGIAAMVGSRFVESRSAAAELITQLQPAADDADLLMADTANLDRSLGDYVLTGRPAELAAYEEAVDGSARQLAAIRSALGAENPQLLGLVDSTAASRGTWLAQVGQPTVAAMDADQRASATKVFSSSASDRAYYRMESDGLALREAIEARRAAQVATTASLSTQLLAAMIASALLLLVGLVLAFVLTGSWVLRPLDSLRIQLRAAATGRRHDCPIEPAGPPEIQAAGRDAEDMRRELVAEIDEARAAREGLLQEGPTVSAIGADLDRPHSMTSLAATVFGELHPAEGVLAGDWWDAIEIDSDRVGLAIADVSGHGVVAGIAGLRLKTAIMAALRSASTAETAMDAAATLFSCAPEQIATCVVAILDARRGTVSWVNAGHPAPILLRADGRPESLGQTGPLLSALGGEWSWRELPLSPADLLLMWTDGVTESRDSAGAQLDERGLGAMARDVAGKHATPQRFVPAFISQVRRRSADWRRDDVTLVAAQLARP